MIIKKDSFLKVYRYNYGCGQLNYRVSQETRDNPGEISIFDRDQEWSHVYARKRQERTEGPSWFANSQYLTDGFDETLSGLEQNSQTREEIEPPKIGLVAVFKIYQEGETD